MKLRKSSIQFKFAPAVLIIFTLGSFAICQSVHGVVPAPDGGYPGLNTAEGTNALKNLTTGVANTGVGWYSLFSNTDGSFNTALGAGRSCSTSEIQPHVKERKTRPSARRLFYPTRPASTTRPLERLPFRTTLARKIRPSVPGHSGTIRWKC